MAKSPLRNVDRPLFSFFLSRRRRHTRCLSDWSSDVCSSDLVPFPRTRWLLPRCWRFEPCAHPLRAGCGCSAAFPVRRPPAGCWRLRSFRSSWRADRNWSQGNQKRKLGASPRFALHPDLAAHALKKPAGNGESQAHALGRFAARQAEEIIENFHVKLRPNSRARVGTAHFDRVRYVRRLTAPVSIGCGLTYAATLPHMRSEE